MEQITIDQYLHTLKTEQSFNRDGSKRTAPSWVQEKRCENCKYWVLLPECDQPAAGWGVKGVCTSHRGQGKYKTDGFSYCDDHSFTE